MKKRSIQNLLIAPLLASVLFASFLLTSCGEKSDEKANSAQTSDTESVIEIKYPLTIKLGYSTSPDDPRGTASLLFKNEVEEKSSGNLKIEIYDSGILGSDNELIAGVIDDDVDMTVSSAGNFSAYATRVGVSALPYLFDDFEDAWAFMDSETISEVNKDLTEYNIHVLSHFNNGFRCVTTSESFGAVNSVSDMKGLAIRTSTNQIVMETMSTLGASPKSYSFTKLIDALKEGKFDAQENPIPVIYNSGIYEVQKYLSITNHSYDAMPFVIREDLWNALSDSDKDIIANAAASAAEKNREIVKQQTSDYVEKLKEKGMVVLYPDLAEFKEATADVKNVFRTVFGSELLETIEDSQ